MKRKSYIKQLEEDLQLSVENNLSTFIIDDLKDRINRYKEYKHNYYINSKTRNKHE